MSPGEFLEHYGVKGMKWGVRNDKGHEGKKVKLKKLSKLDQKWDRKNSSISTLVKMQNSVADKLNGPGGGLQKVNTKPKYRDMDFRKPDQASLHQQYFRDIAGVTHKAYQEVAKDAGVNPSGTKRIGAERHGNQVFFTFQDVSHADFEDEFRLVGDLDAKGFITSLRESSVEQSDLSAEEYLAHYGVLGMRWGKRKAEIPASADAAKKEEIKNKVKLGKVKALSDRELITAINRMNLEQSYKRLAVNEKPAITRFISSTIMEIGKREVQSAAAKGAARLIAKAAAGV